MYKNRSRVIYGLMIVIVIGLGLASRSGSPLLPELVATYAGDILWALLVFLLLGFLIPSQQTAKIGAIALLFSFSIEVSQLYHAPWIDAIRQTRLGGLVLGYGFLWSDLLSYSIGIFIGLMSEAIAQQYQKLYHN